MFEVAYKVVVYKTVVENHIGWLDDEDLITINRELVRFKDVEPLTQEELIEILHYRGRWDQPLVSMITDKLEWCLGEFVEYYMSANAKVVETRSEDIYDIGIEDIDITGKINNESDNR